MMTGPAAVTLGEILLDSFPRLFEAVLDDNGQININKKRNFEVVV